MKQKGKQDFHPESFEKKWQGIWRKVRIYQPDIRIDKNDGNKPTNQPFYNLMMFPYPSAEGLHVGNVYAFTGADIYGRFMRMKGNDVFEPIGLDGFGIHSENYAIKVGKHPKELAKISEENFYRQLASIGNGFAWENRLETYDPDYYKWTQWIFVEMFKHGLAYRKKSPVNFCPKDKTVLSDEQVINGVCERCGTLVEKRDMEQWFFRITEYAERLLQNTHRKDFHWPEKVKIGQRNWIGKKEGISIKYTVILASGARPGSEHSSKRSSDSGQARMTDYFITCFTTRPDTNFGATFVVIAPEHPFVKDIINRKIKVPEAKRIETTKYIAISQRKSQEERIAAGREKTGVFTGLYCLNNLNGYKMPLYISDFVLVEFGTGAVVGVPGHDTRDFDFATKFNLPIKRVVVGSDGDTSPIIKIEQVQEEEGTMINSEFLNGMDIHEATRKMMDYLEKKGWGKRVTTYKLRDWCISRQRYWGAPIPMVYCKSCAEKGIGWLSMNKDKSLESRITNHESREKFEFRTSNFVLRTSNLMPGWYPVPEDQLPILLPDLNDWKPEGTGKGPLAKLPDFIKTKCPHCGSESERETDVCDTFLDSSWYFLRYPTIGSQKEKNVIPTKSEGRVEGSHSSEVGRYEIPRLPSVARNDTQDLPWDGEITKKWLPVNMYIGGAEHTVLHLLYSRFVTMSFHDWGLLEFEEPYKRFYAHGLIIKDGAKMSKSKGNVVVPDDYIRKYGSDTLRSYLMFLGPFDQGGDFRDTGIAGMYKFLGRVWRLVESFRHPPVGGSRESSMDPRMREDDNINRIMHKTIKEVTEDLAGLRYNTAISHIMEYVNAISNIKYQISNIPKKYIETLLLLLAPFAPHMTEELYQQLFQGTANSEFSSIHKQKWPSYEEKFLVEDTVTIVVQVNGKVREALSVKREASSVKNEIEKMALESDKVKKFLEAKPVKKTIFVPGRLVNFVV